MRINKYIASGSSLSRRAADQAIAEGRVTINGRTATTGETITETDEIALDGRLIRPAVAITTLLFNKPTGYVCSRNGQGSQTIYDILPAEYRSLNPVGRLDKDSSGLLLLTNDGQLAEQLTHPRYAKTKLYEVTLDKPLQPLHQQIITDYGVTLSDGLSRFSVARIDGHAERGRGRTASEEGKTVSLQSDGSTSRGAHPSLKTEKSTTAYQITMAEGRNRQIRRTFAALGYTVAALHRTHFGPYALGSLGEGQYQSISTS